MLTRRFVATAVAAVAFVAASGGAHAAERSLMGIVLGRSYRQVLAKFGTPAKWQPVQIPVPGQGVPGAADQGIAGMPGGYGAPGYGAPAYGPPGGYGAPGADTSSVPSYGAPATTGGGPPGYPGGGGPSYGAPAGGPPGYGGPMGASTGGGPPVLPPIGGAPSAPGYGTPGGYGAPGGYGDTGAGGITGTSNGVEWIYIKPGGVTLSFVINEDGRVAQISVSGRKFAPARTSKGMTLGSEYKRVVAAYGFPQTHLMGGYFVEAYYTKNHHAAFSFVNGKLVRITIALAD